MTEIAANAADAEPATPRRSRRASALAFLSLVVLVFAIGLGIASCTAAPVIQYCPGVRKVNEGPIRARIMRYECGLSLGQIAIYRTRDDFNTDDVGTTAGWSWHTARPQSLVTQPTWGDLINLRFAGFQWYRGSFLRPSDTYRIGNDVRSIVVPLWPALLAVIPPWRWWRQRRGLARGFPVATADAGAVR